MTVLGPPLDKISAQARPYPAHLLNGCETGLCLFSAAFDGWNDAIHMARNDLETTCVDIDATRLLEMRDLYPESWTFLAADAWEFAERVRIRWDAVSVDTFTGEATERSLQSLDLWCSLANKVVTVTLTDGAGYETPTGWLAWTFPRSGVVSWLVLEKA